MRNLKSFILICFTLAAFTMNAQPVIIQGSAPTYKGSSIAAYSYKDLITNTPVKIGSCMVRDTGAFLIKLDNITQSQYLYLNISNQNGSIYVSPGHTYHVIFPPPDTNHYENPYISHPVDLTFLINDTDNINNLIIDFNDHFDEFWKKNYLYILKKEGTRYIDTFYMQMKDYYNTVHNAYFEGYMRYTIAELEVNTLVGPKTLGNKYLKGRPILYHNYEYMKFFNDYFDDYLQQQALSKEGGKVTGLIQQNDYNGLKEILKINPLLAGSDSLCELVLLKGLYELYYSGNFNQDGIKTMLENIKLSSNINEDRIIAANMLGSFSNVVKGALAPDFTLKDEKGEMSSSLDFRGRFVYLCFFKSTSEVCLSELTVMAALYKKYGKKMYFVCISEDKTPGDMQKFLEQNKTFDWPFLFDEGGKILDKYNAKAMPEFFLINQQGYFYQSPADGPSHGIELTLDRLMPAKRKLHNDNE